MNRNKAFPVSGYKYAFYAFGASNKRPLEELLHFSALQAAVWCICALTEFISKVAAAEQRE